jgi:hypothetical protein
MVAHTLEKCMADQKEILHTIQIFQGKFELSESAYEIKFKVSKASSDLGSSKHPTEAPTYDVTRDYLIKLNNNSYPTHNQIADE